MAEWHFASTNVGKMESPLEQLFLAHWALLICGCAPCQYGGKQAKRGLPTFNLRAQERIGPHRVDFVLDVLEIGATVVRSAVIEVDGFAYHGDKESFSADRARDQFLSAKGYTVFRFTYDALVGNNPLKDLLAWTRMVRPLGDEPGTLGAALKGLEFRP